jgi:hypothetical protein
VGIRRDAAVPKEVTMLHRQICTLATVLSGLLICAGFSGKAAAGGAYPVGFYLSCGARLDLCIPICDGMVPGGILLGRCYDRCSTGAGICEASRMPVPGRSVRR